MHGWSPLTPVRFGHGVRCASFAHTAPRMSFSLPSFSRDEQPSGPSEEVQGLFCMLGLDEDATYDEINVAYDALAVKYEGDTKRLIKLQVAKDKILEDRLRQRMSGAMKAAVARARGTGRTRRSRSSASPRSCRA